MEKLKTGTVGASFLRDPSAVFGAKEASSRALDARAEGAIVLLNMGANVNCAGGKPELALCLQARPARHRQLRRRRAKVRQAIAAAIDPKVLNEQRVRRQVAARHQMLPSTFVGSRRAGLCSTSTTPRRLVTEVKSAGWNGNLRLVFVNSELSKNSGLSIQTI